MRTLVVSDLHLGARVRASVLARPEPLRRLLRALDGIDRLVLLGDLIENADRRAAEAAARALGAIGRALGPERPVVIVPGNHDLVLIWPWIRAQRSRLGTSDPVPVEELPGMALVASWLRPARVSVDYPGTWLSDRVWATHGHYLDKHLLPESSFGLKRGSLNHRPVGRAAPRDYEPRIRMRGRRFPAAPTPALPRPVATIVGDAAGLARAATMPLSPRRLLRPSLARVTSRVLDTQMRWASIPSMAHVAQRLGVDAEWVIYGHVHRLGPRDGDDLEQWRGPDGRPRLVNSGSWVYDPRLVHSAGGPQPYWPGGAVLVEDGGDPVVLGLLDDLPAGALK